MNMEYTKHFQNIVFTIFFYFIKDLKHFQNDIIMYNNYSHLYIMKCNHNI
jgi:hypothetical protein